MILTDIDQICNTRLHFQPWHWVESSIGGDTHEKPAISGKTERITQGLGYRQDDVAAVLGCVRQTYSHYETGKRTPDHEVLFKLAGLYHVSVDDLMQLAVELDREEYFDAPAPTQSSEDLAGFLDYFNNPHNQKKFQYFGNLEKELIYYFEKLSDTDKRELIEIAKIKTRK